ncbi:hypothetical protein VC273_00925 [Xanthomonas nasturtii]|uniref:hypothetical protein n=1 Tax=Xanthomonas nasturtii TaxID=1843581 RepID=UPI002B2381B0|nr:hypothetical protein [Xanthomonas nasturtii]MEA9554536.1 hypothetical protein [Xanthomonas nasturtii]
MADEGKLLFHSKVEAECPSLKSYEIAFVGKPVDDRGIAACKAVAGSCTTVHKFEVDVYNSTYKIDGVIKHPPEIAKIIRDSNANHVLLEATTLGLAELLVLLRVLHTAGLDSVKILYVEPAEYTASRSREEASDQEEYKLSLNQKFCGVHGFMHQYDERSRNNHVFFVGFEAGRVLNAFEQRNYEKNGPTSFAIIAGVPAFIPGWELATIDAHLPALEDLGVTAGGIYYAEASSIRDAYRMLWRLYSSSASEHSIFYVSPLGTKPHAIGAALFLLETRQGDRATSLFYDHPQRVSGRSSGVGSWHLVNVSGFIS